MDTQMLYIILIIIAILAVLYRIWVNDGYSFKPFFDETGKFQMAIIGNIIAGLIVAIPIIDATSLIGDPIMIVLGLFFTVAGIPGVVEHILTKSSIGNPELTEPDPPITESA